MIEMLGGSVVPEGQCTLKVKEHDTAMIVASATYGCSAATNTLKYTSVP